MAGNFDYNRTGGIMEALTDEQTKTNNIVDRIESLPQPNTVPPKADQAIQAKLQAMIGTERPSLPNTMGMNKIEKARATAEWRQKKEQFRIAKAQKQLEEKAKFGDKKSQEKMAKQAIDKQEQADRKQAKIDQKQKEINQQQIAEKAEADKLAQAIKDATKGLEAKIEDLSLQVSILDDVASLETDLQTEIPQRFDRLMLDADFVDRSYTRSVDFYNNQFVSLYGFYSYDNRDEVDAYDGVLVRDKNAPYSLKYVDAYVFGGGTESPHRWNVEPNAEGTRAVFITGGSITCRNRRISVQPDDSIEFPDATTYDNTNLIAITNDDYETVDLYWEAQLDDARLRASNIIRVANFSYTEPNWSKTEQYMLSDVISNEDRHSMRFQLESIDKNTGAGLWRVPASKVLVNGYPVDVPELSNIGDNEDVYLNIYTAHTGLPLSATFATNAEPINLNRRSLMVGIAGFNAVEYMPQSIELPRTDTNISVTLPSSGTGKSIDITDNTNATTIRNFKEGTETVLRVNPTDTPADYDNNRMMVRDTISGLEVKYATASSTIDWLTYDTTNMFPYQKIGGLYDYIRDTVDITGDFWRTNGDETTCYGSAIGSQSTAVVIQLNGQYLVGDWYATSSFYSPYIHADVVDAYQYMITPNIYCDTIYPKINTFIEIKGDTYIYDNVFVTLGVEALDVSCDHVYAQTETEITFHSNIYETGTISSAGNISSENQIEATMGFRINGSDGGSAGNIYLYDTAGGYGVYSFNGGLLVPAI